MRRQLQPIDLQAILRGRPRTQGLRRLRLPVTLVTSILTINALLTREAPAQPSAPSQYDVEAVYLFDFAKFVRWPADGDRSPLTICVAGQKVYHDTLSKIVAGERVEDRPLNIRSVDRPENEQGCSILFIDTSAKERLDSLLAAAAGKPLLTVSDMPGFLDRGGMIQFLIIGNRVRFSVDLRPVMRSGISLSSELLKVAAAVKGVPADGGTP